MEKEKVVVILSGGMDSTTLLYKAVKEAEVVSVLSFDYGQRHKKELISAKASCEKLGVPHKVIDITSINAVMKNSSLTDDVEVPEGNYADENMKLTVVPNRNMILLSIAVAEAVSCKASKVYFGAHAGDHTIYPDCRKEFVEKLSEVTKIANWQSVEIEAPFADLDKGDIAILGKELGVDYSLTWTCYKGLDKPCDKCGACQERKFAFEKAQM